MVGKINKKWVLCFVLLLLLCISILQLGSPTVIDTSPRTSEQRIALILNELPERDVYITHNNQIAYLTYYLNYQYNYSGLYGYRGATTHSFYDLHFVKDLEELHNAYVLIDYRMISEGIDYRDYYQQRDGSIEYLRFTSPPPSWRGIYGLTDENVTIVGGIWAVE